MPKGQAGDSGERLQMGAGSARLGASWQWTTPWLDLGPEVQAEFLIVHGTASGTATPTFAATYTSAFDFGFLAVLGGKSRWAAVARVAAVVPLHRPTFSVGEVGEVHEIPSISLRGQVGVGYRF